MTIRSIFGSALLTVGAMIAQSANAEDCKPLTLATTAKMEPTEGGRPVLPVKINGTPRNFLFDTGGVVILVSPSVVKELNLHTRESPIKLFDVGGNISQAMTTLDSFELGPLVAKHLDVAVGTSGAGSDVDGLLTPSLFRTDIDMDFGPGRFSLFLQDHCEGKVVYWKSDAIAVVAVRTDDLHINVPVVIDGHELRAIIDTGASGTFMDMNTARRVFGLTPDSPGMKNVGIANNDPNLPLYEHVFSSLSFEGITVSNAHVKIMPDMIDSKDKENSFQTGSHVMRVDDEITRVPVTIGMNVLKKLHVYMAFKERKLYISPASAPDSPNPFAAIQPAK